MYVLTKDLEVYGIDGMAQVGWEAVPLGVTCLEDERDDM